MGDNPRIGGEKRPKSEDKGKWAMSLVGIAAIVGGRRDQGDKTVLLYYLKKIIEGWGVYHPQD